MSDLLGMVRRHWWIVALLTIFGVVGAYEVTARQPKVFESATSVLVQPTGAGQDTNVSGGRTKGEINLDTEAQLVRSTAVATDAAQLLRSTAAPDSLAGKVSVEVPANTSVLVITFKAGGARDAQAGSHAFAEAYLRNREETAANELAEQIATIDGKLKQLNAALAPINSRLASLRPDSSERPNLESQRLTITNQVNTLSARLNQLVTTTVSAGKIIRDANLPERPSKPVLPLNLGSGAAVGLLLGAGAAILRERLDRRIRRPDDLTRRCDVAVLAALPPKVRPRLDDVFPPFGAGGRVFNRLRNEVVAGSPMKENGTGRALAERGDRGQVIVVAGASRGSASTVVAANLAAAFARTGGQTVLVCAHLPDSVAELAPVTRLLGVRAVPGLSDVLAGKVALGRAVQRASRQPRLSVITTGGTASASGLLQSQMLRDALTSLRRQAEYVVIEAPATSTSADAQSVASLADIALVAVELKRTRYADVTDAAEQLRRVGTPLLGAVVLPRLVRHRDEPPPAPARAHDEDDDNDALDLDEEETEDEAVADADTVVMKKVGTRKKPRKAPATNTSAPR
ncbi:Wzz/FepE/Etk N-terminal domain-containing protein [Virgisporangium aurantiacum]|nr:Wzz/FepE/Etk N-terminal domain-containing protein [Virgisporangium aurantiacum]